MKDLELPSFKWPMPWNREQKMANMLFLIMLIPLRLFLAHCSPELINTLALKIIKSNWVGLLKSTVGYHMILLKPPFLFLALSNNFQTQQNLINKLQRNRMQSVQCTLLICLFIPAKFHSAKILLKVLNDLQFKISGVHLLLILELTLLPVSLLEDVIS